MSFPFYKQLDSMDCGPTCLKMIAEYYGRNVEINVLRKKCCIDKSGVNLEGLVEASSFLGFHSEAWNLEIEDLKTSKFPVILHWNQNHFVVCYKISKKYVWIADPAVGKLKYSIEDLNEHWVTKNNCGVALLLNPQDDFDDSKFNNSEKKNFSFLFQYLKPHKKLIAQLFIGLLLGTLFQLIFPFLTQSLVDIGIDTQNLNFIYIILAGQLMLFFSSTVVKFIQSWILLHISVRVNVHLLSDFLIKLMNLPLGFFDTKNMGDLLQRINDHKRIETFLTNTSLGALLAVTNLVVFGIVLAYYSLQIFLIFVIASVAYISWIFIFLRKRKLIDHKAFQELSNHKDSLIEIIRGMPEIKLQGSQAKHRFKWANIQAKLFRVQMQALSINQYQDAGALFINQLKDILITFLAAKLVLEGKMTLGMMLAVQYIIGQLNAPLQQLIGCARSTQDAHISLDRLWEIHNAKNEEEKENHKLNFVPNGDIVISNLSFSYTPISETVLDNINLTIERGKTTAIVGTSGSGKTTLIKLLLGFYKPSYGSIEVGGKDLSSIYTEIWRNNCGVVMQDGFIFSDNIANNIAESDDVTDFSKVLAASTTANILDFVKSLPLGFKTMVGAKGNGLSQGQKQRLFIARAVYKNPEFLFFDEATNALDASNERIILDNLSKFMEHKTSIVVAHRLSTVKNADKIIVLHKGKIVEAGKHESLVASQGFYFNLVKNQLELGN